MLPDSRPREKKNGHFDRKTGVWWYPTYCANCGAGGQSAPETSTYDFWVCNKPDCAKWGDSAIFEETPDSVFFAKSVNEQLNQIGRTMTLEEAMKALEDRNNPLSKLCREHLKARTNNHGF